MKHCPNEKCPQINPQPLENFSKLKSSRDGLQYNCKACKKIWTDKNKELTHFRTKNWQTNNPARFNELKYNYRMRTKSYIKEKAREYNTKNKDKINAYHAKRRQNNPKIAKMSKIRVAIKDAMKTNSVESLGTYYLGCTIPFFRAYIESMWSEGMTWENRKSRGWHIDHIIPIKTFDLTQETECLKAFNYTNCQPLWAEQHRIKSAQEMKVDYKEKFK